ncbi:unnamed protein product [Rhizophagus irregularis]|nr:unnamed protein product [Rhizophagus irregularis]
MSMREYQQEIKKKVSYSYVPSIIPTKLHNENCSGLQNKKYRRSSRVHRALLRKKNREEDEGENQREKNRKARLKKDLMLAGGTRVYKNLTVLQGHLYEASRQIDQFSSITAFHPSTFNQSSFNCIFCFLSL